MNLVRHRCSRCLRIQVASLQLPPAECTRQICCSRACLIALSAKCHGNRYEDRTGTIGSAVYDHQHHSLKKLPYKLLLQSAWACIRQPSACRGSSMSQCSQQMIQLQQAAMPGSICAVIPFVMLIASNLTPSPCQHNVALVLSSCFELERLLHSYRLPALRVIP